MTPSSVADEKLGKFARQQHDWFERVRKGSLDPEAVAREVQKLINPPTASSVSGNVIREDWEKFYAPPLGIDMDFSNVLIRNKRGFNRVILVAQGLTLNRVYEACKRDFPCYSYYTDLDKAVIKNDRSPDVESYAIRIRDRVEADKELAKLSAEDLQTQGIQGVTLLERLVQEHKYFKETGQHLDRRNRTLCSGSQDACGSVPNVFWDGDKLCVAWCNPRTADSCLRARAVVS